MRTSVGIILSFVIFIQSLGFNVNSLVQIDDLWSHYQEHKTEYGDDFLTFLDLHYGSQQEDHRDEHPEHQDLPSQFNLQFQLTYFVEPHSTDFLIHIPFETTQHHFGYAVNFTSLLETDILQPPKRHA